MERREKEEEKKRLQEEKEEREAQEGGGEKKKKKGGDKVKKRKPAAPPRRTSTEMSSTRRSTFYSWHPEVLKLLPSFIQDMMGIQTIGHIIFDHKVAVSLREWVSAGKGFCAFRKYLEVLHRGSYMERHHVSKESYDNLAQIPNLEKITSNFTLSQSSLKAVGEEGTTFSFVLL